jgi:hypothetical protein
MIVHSSLPNAVELRLHKMTAGEFGHLTARPVGAIVLRPGRNEVDAAFWQDWLAQNQTSDLASAFSVEQPARPL